MLIGERRRRRRPDLHEKMETAENPLMANSKEGREGGRGERTGQPKTVRGCFICIPHFENFVASPPGGAYNLDLLTWPQKISVADWAQKIAIF